MSITSDTTSTIVTSIVIIAKTEKVLSGQRSRKDFLIDADEGKIYIEVLPAYIGINSDTVKIWIDGGLFNTFVFKDLYRSFYFSKVLDKGYHDFEILFESEIASHFIWYSLTLEPATVVKTGTSAERAPQLIEIPPPDPIIELSIQPAPQPILMPVPQPILTPIPQPIVEPILQPPTQPAVEERWCFLFSIGLVVLNFLMTMF